MGAKRGRPNILFIQVDQLSAASLNAYGNRSSITPNLDRLAERSVIFDNAYCNFPLCAPSRASMMTGRLATRVQAYDNAAELPATVPTLAHYLRSSGYRTILSGKMHFIGPDLLHGFEHRLTPEIYSSDLIWLPDWSNTTTDEFASDAAEALEKAGPAPRTVQMDYDEEVLFKAKRALFDLARDDDDRPFFLLASFTHPHEPYVCSQFDWDRYDGREIDMPVLFHIPQRELDEHAARTYRHYNLHSPRITESNTLRARRAYYGSLSYVDRLIGELLEGLEAAGFGDSTIIFFTADHGDMLGERGMWFKKVFYENAMHIPLFVVHPEVRARRVTTNVSLVDMLPTLADLAADGAGFMPATDLDGSSLKALLSGNGGTPDAEVLGELTCEGVSEPVVMLRKGRFKIVYSEETTPLLFDLVSDPHELKNLSDDPAHTSTLAALRARIGNIWGDLGQLKREIVASQRARALVASALDQGKFHSWDDLDTAQDGSRYLRRGKSYNAWNYFGVDRLRIKG